MEKKFKKREKLIIGMLAVLSVVTIITMITSASFYGKMVNSLNEVKNTQTIQYEDHVETRQFLLSTIDWETNRQKTILFMRDIIIKEWGRCGFDLDYNKAYLIAETNMKESEKYPYFNPLFILAVQWKESSFSDTIVSKMGARGLMQIMPPTGRLLSGFFDMQYSNDMLFNLTTNIKFGSKYLDVLYAEYGDFETTLAAYNGGYWQAYYFNNEPEKLAEETSNYVPMIMSKWAQYKEQIQTYKIDEIMNIR